MRRRVLVLPVTIAALILSSVSCSRRSSQAHGTVPAPKSQRKSSAPPARAVTLAMERQVRNALDAGEGDALVRYLRQKISSDPDHTAARLELASQYEKQGAYELAIEHLRIAAARRPDDEAVVRRLAQALQSNEQQIDAIAVLATFCESPGGAGASAALLEELALLEDEAGALAEGERFHRRAIAADASDDKLRNNLGYNFLQQARLADAVHEFQAALQLNPASEAARNNLGTALARSGKSEEAVLQWSSILGPAAARNNLAAVLMEKGDLKGARKEIEAALDYDRHNPAAMRNLQFLAELDGKPASFTISSKEIRRPATGWGRIPAALGRMLHPDRGSQPQNAAAAASAKAADKR